MKSLLMAAGLIAAGLTSGGFVAATATSALAQPYPYATRNHDFCQDKARRLHDFERRAASDGRIDRREQRTIEALRRDLRRTCGGFRWRG